MPIQSCNKNKKKGFKFGTSGTCYTGPGALKKAQKQASAIKSSQAKRKKRRKNHGS